MSASTAVTVKPVPTATIRLIGPAHFCFLGSVTLTSSSAGYRWKLQMVTRWYDNSSSYSQHNRKYIVTVTNNSGCSATSAPLSVTVTSGAPTPKITAVALQHFVRAEAWF